MNSRASNMFRFSVALFDLFSLNILNLLLMMGADDLFRQKPYIHLLIAINITWMVCSYVTSMYVGKHRGYEDFFKRSVQAFVLFLTFSLLFIFLNKYAYSRFYVIMSYSLFGTIVLISRTVLFGANYVYQSRPAQKRKVVVLGYNHVSENLVETFATRENKKVAFAGFFDDHLQASAANGMAYLGKIKESLPYALQHNVSEIYSVISPEVNTDIYELAQQAERNFIRFKFVPDLRMFVNRRTHLDFSEDVPILSLRPEPLEAVDSQLKKRTFDVLFSLFVIVFVLSWLTPIIALVIKLNSKGPVFFKQLRSGKNNRYFPCYKFRSLRVSDSADKIQVTKSDDRMTAVGKFLRKTNIDELPQFFNVLRGEMSVVGPRPHMLKHTEDYPKLMSQYMIRHYVKPGITGWAQINGYRGEISTYNDLCNRVEFDIHYMENWSLWFDIRIILLTAYKTFKGDEKAY